MYIAKDLEENDDPNDDDKFETLRMSLDDMYLSDDGNLYFMFSILVLHCYICCHENATDQ